MLSWFSFQSVNLNFKLQVEFRENSELAKVDRVKIVACDAKSSVPARTDD